MEGTGCQFIHMMLRKNKIMLLLPCLILILVSNLGAPERDIMDNPLYLKSFLVYLKGDAYNTKYKYDDALNHYKKAVKIFKQYPEPYFKMASIYFNKKDYNAVEQYLVLSEKYRSFFRNNNELAGFYKLSGEYYEHKEKYKKSLDNYTNYVSIISNENTINHRIGYLYYKLKQPDKSLLHLEKFIRSKEINKRYRERYSDEIKKSYMIIINTYMDRNRYRKSLKYLKELYLYYPEREIKERITVLSNNLKHYK